MLPISISWCDVTRDRWNPHLHPPTDSSPPLLSANLRFQVPIITFSLLLSKLRQQFPMEVGTVLKGIKTLRSLAPHRRVCVGGWPYRLLDAIADFSHIATAVRAYWHSESSERIFSGSMNVLSAVDVCILKCELSGLPFIRASNLEANSTFSWTPELPTQRL